MIHVLVFISSRIPSNIISILRPLRELEKNGDVLFRVRPESTSFFFDNDICWCDVAIFSRSQSVAALRALIELKKKNKKVLYDIDDNFFEIPLNTKLGQYHRNVNQLLVQKLFYQHADLVHVYSPIMEKQVLSCAGRVKLMRSYFDKSLVSDGISNFSSSKVIKIAYATGRIDDPRLEEIIFSAIKTVAEKYSTQVEFHFWGTKKNLLLKGLPNIVLNSPVLGYEKFIKSFQFKCFDIGLAPVLEDVFFQSKTNNKYREYGGCLVAGIYSDMLPYNDCIIHKRNGYLVENTVDAWVNGLIELIESKELRENIASTAQGNVFNHYSFENYTRNFKSSLHKILEEPVEDFVEVFDDIEVLDELVVIILGDNKRNKGFFEDRVPTLYKNFGIIMPITYYSKLTNEVYEYLLSMRKGEILVVVNRLSEITNLIQLFKWLPKNVRVKVDLGDFISFTKSEEKKVREFFDLVDIQGLICRDRLLEKHPYIVQLCKNIKIFRYQYGTLEDAFSLQGRSAALLQLEINNSLPNIFYRHGRMKNHVLQIPFWGRFSRYVTLVRAVLNRAKEMSIFLMWRLGRRNF